MNTVDQSAGYVRLYRKLLQSPIWIQLSPVVLKVAVYFLLRANFKQGQWYDGKRVVNIPAGSFITSYARTAAACGLSVQQIRDASAHLFRTQFATYTRTEWWTLVTVLNWSSYQASADDEEHSEEHAVDRPENRQGTTNKNVRSKEVKTCASDEAHEDAFPSIDELLFETTDPGTLFPVDGKPKPAKTGLTEQQEIWFGQWWPGYWRKKSKKEAREAFRKHVTSEARFQQVMAATRAQNPEMLERPPAKRPYGATWLNGEGWEDEIEMPGTARKEPVRMMA